MTPDISPPPGSKARGLAWLIMLFMPLGCGALAVWLGPDANWDLRNYHWYNAYAFLNGRHGFDLLPSQTPFFYSPFLDVPLYLLAKYLPAKLFTFLLGAMQGINGCLLFMIAHAVLVVPKAKRRVLAAAVLAVMGMLGGGGVALLGAIFNDNLASIGFLLSVLLLAADMPYLLTLPERVIWKRVFLYGLPAGLALGLKLTLITFCAALPLALLCVGGSMQRRLSLAFIFGCGIAAGAVITQGYWMWHLWTHYRNPVFPYFNQYFASPYAPLTSARDVQFVPNNWHDRLLFPFIFAEDPKRVGEILWRDFRIPALYALLPVAAFLALIAGKKRDRTQDVALPIPARFLLWLGVFCYLGWLFMFGIYRYLVILEMLAPLLIVLAVGLLPFRRLMKILAAAAILIALATTVQWGDWGRASGWSEKLVTAKVPEIAEPENKMLLMAGYEPYAHIVPFFPPVMPVLRFQSNFASPREDKGINLVLKQRIAAHPGGFLLVLPAWQAPYSQFIQNDLGLFGLASDMKSCRTFPDNMGYSYALCDVKRQRGKHE